MLTELEKIFDERYGTTNTILFYTWLNRIFHEFPDAEDNEVYKIAKERLLNV